MFREKLRIRLMFFEKSSEIWPKRPVRIVVWVGGENTGVRSSQQAQQASTRLRILRCSGPLPEQSKLLAGARVSGGDCKNSTRRGAVFGLPKSLSLRASPRREASALGVQTGAAIRPTCGQAAIPVCRLIRLFAGTARCRSPAPSSPPWWPRSG